MSQNFNLMGMSDGNGVKVRWSECVVAGRIKAVVGCRGVLFYYTRYNKVVFHSNEN